MGSLRIGFTSPQGGSGVTTVTVATASRIHYYHKIPVAVVDCDVEKQSCAFLRKKENVTEDRYPLYDILTMAPGEIGTVEHEWEPERKPDVIFYDLAGNMDSSVLSKMDYVFVPVVSSHMLGNGIRAVLRTAEEFYKAKADTKFRLFLNKCKPYGPERLWDLVCDSGMTPCDQIYVTEARIFSRQAILNNVSSEKPAITTTGTLDDHIMKTVGFYNLETFVLRDIKRPRTWK